MLSLSWEASAKGHLPPSFPGGKLTLPSRILLASTSLPGYFTYILCHVLCRMITSLSCIIQSKFVRSSEVLVLIYLGIFTVVFTYLRVVLTCTFLGTYFLTYLSPTPNQDRRYLTCASPSVSSPQARQATCRHAPSNDDSANGPDSASRGTRSASSQSSTRSTPRRCLSRGTTHWPGPCPTATTERGGPVDPRRANIETPFCAGQREPSLRLAPRPAGGTVRR